MAFHNTDSQMEDWVIVPNMNSTQSTEPFSASRPPQRKVETMSSKQVADTTAALDYRVAQLGAVMESKPTIGPYDPSYTVGHKPPSNSTNSTNTSGTTAQANITSAAAAFTSPSAFTYTPTGLTENVLAQHELEINTLRPEGTYAWVEGAAPGYTKLAVSMEYKGQSCHRTRRSMPSQASDTSYERVASPHSENGRELVIRGAGARFTEQCANPYVYSQYIDLSEV